MKTRRKLKSLEEISELEHGRSNVFCVSLREKYADRPVELEDVRGVARILKKGGLISQGITLSVRKHARTRGVWGHAPPGKF